MKTTTGSMIKISYNNKYHIVYNKTNIWEHDKHLLLLHKHDLELINQIINNDMWHEWKNKYFMEEWEHEV